MGNVALLDHALNRLTPLTGAGPEHLAVNAFHHAEAIVQHCGNRVTVAVEEGESRGTAGGVANLLPWLDGRDALVTNADQYLPDGLGGFTEGWDASAAVCSACHDG